MRVFTGQITLAPTPSVVVWCKLTFPARTAGFPCSAGPRSPHSAVRCEQLASCFIEDQARAEHVFDSLGFRPAGACLQFLREGLRELVFEESASGCPFACEGVS